MKIVLATTNQGKAKEISYLLKDLSILLIPQAEFNLPEIPETGTTFFENAILKARQVAKWTGLPALADDSGLVVDCLQGAPGVYSSRYAGEGATNAMLIAKLLSALKDQNDHVELDHTPPVASYHCVLALMRFEEDPAPIVSHGIWHGSISKQPKGSHGFGYDPVFYVPTHHCSAAELDTAEKNRISHRARAMTEFKAKLIQEMHITNCKLRFVQS